MSGSAVKFELQRAELLFDRAHDRPIRRPKRVGGRVIPGGRSDS